MIVDTGTLDGVEDMMEQLYVIHYRSIQSLFLNELKEIFSWWKRKFPKRELKWIDAMGTGFFMIDGEIFDDDVHNIYTHQNRPEGEWTRKQRLLKPLILFIEMTKDVTWTPQSGVSIGEHTQPPVITSKQNS